MEQLFDNAPLELGMQELDELDAPGWWSNFKDGVTISATISSVYASVATAVAT